MELNNYFPQLKNLISKLPPCGKKSIYTSTSLMPFLIVLLNQIKKKPLFVVTSETERLANLKEAVQKVINIFNLNIPLIHLQKFNLGEAINNLINQLNSSVLPVAFLHRDIFSQYLPPFSLQPPFELTQGEVFIYEELIEKLLSYGYKKVNLVNTSNEFSHRGSIVDIYPPTLQLPVRIEFWGDEIESIKEFVPETQRSKGNIEKVTIPTVSLIKFSSSLVEEGIKKLKSTIISLKKHIAPQIISYYQKKIDTLYQSYLEEHNDLLFWEFPEYFFKELKTIPELLPKESVILSDCTSFASSQYVLNNPIPSEQLSILLSNHLHIKINSEKRENGETLNLITLPLPVYHKNPILLTCDIKEWIKQKKSIIIITNQSENLIKLFKQELIPYTLTPTKERAPLLIQGSVPFSGFVFKDTILITNSELSKKRAIPSYSLKDYPPLLIDKLETGSYVIHNNYGIARYVGLKKLSIESLEREFITLQFAEDAKIYIPVEEIHLIHPYNGQKDTPPKLSRLGSKEWSQIKHKIKKSVKNLAKQLLELYALREHSCGFAFPPDTPWQSELEDDFPYQETPDQIKALAEVKRDMESLRPMDRLICGEVGYGKTEIALRAAFKAISAGKQVFFITPTTILAYQHFINFKDRFKKYPINVKMLSRLIKQSEQKKIVRGVNTGTVDIVIGTHRLLQDDVHPANLGLLIIDEEQRFGVLHKEKIKMLKHNVDVLTLTATPIPRTLYMSITGLRDISILNTPPPERLPIITIIEEKNPYTLKRAVEQELQRKGQIFYLHNSVNTIKQEANYLKKLLPHLKIAIAHGKMEERKLENVIIDFLEQKYDLLLCTTIIEIGIDFPKVNTLIVNGAENLGLVELHQLRGRIGRGKEQAYAYFFYDPSKITSKSAERLQVLSEYSYLGAGWDIAQRDLQLRGAGNIFGPEQHGFIMGIGLDLYTELLKEAIREIKGIPPPLPPPEIKLSLPAYIPTEYITELRQRLAIYRKISTSTKLEEIEEIREELSDRFGQLPAQGENLLLLAKVKLLLTELKAKNLLINKDKVIINFWASPPPPPLDFKLSKNQIVISNKSKSPKEWLVWLENFLYKWIKQIC